MSANPVLIASDGRRYWFDERDRFYYSYYQSGTEGMRSEFGFRPSGLVESPVFKAAGDLMYYPMLPFVAYDAVKDALSRSLP